MSKSKRRLLSGWPPIPIHNTDNIRPERTGSILESERPTWDEIWHQMAEIISTRSKCDRAKIGCVIVAKDQTVISASYNGPPPGYSVEGTCTNWCDRAKGRDSLDSNYDACPSSHAEINGIARADFSRILGATLYCNQAVCMNCAKAIAASGVSKVVHYVDEKSLHRNPNEVEQFLERCGVEVERYV